MTREEAMYELKNAAWLGTDHSRARTEEALDMAIKALERANDDWKEGFDMGWKEAKVFYEEEPCDEKRDCSTCKYEEYSSNYQPCRDCGTLLESYTNWEQKERELPCIYDFKNRYCPRLNESGILTYPQQEVKQEPCDDAISREAVKNMLWKAIEDLEDLPSLTNGGKSK